MRFFRDRGAAAVEAAIIVPLIAFVTFGTLEAGLYWQLDHTLNDAARSGARIGATIAREPNYHLDILEAAEERLATAPNESIDSITIYKADSSSGDPITGDVETCVTDCWRATWNTSTKSFDIVSGPEWAPLDQAACGGEDSTDYLGVWVEGTYQSATGMLGDRTVTERTILRLEPVPLSQTCQPTP